MLVVKDRYGMTVFLEDPDARFEKLVARIEFLTDLVDRVLAVFSANQDRIHRQCLPTAPQGLGYRRIDLETELARPVGALVAFGMLIDIERDDPRVRAMPTSGTRVADQE